MVHASRRAEPRHPLATAAGLRLRHRLGQTSPPQPRPAFRSLCPSLGTPGLAGLGGLSSPSATLTIGKRQPWDGHAPRVEGRGA
eukprot:scaffold3460_cov115-Isochrysis_galbana.AAC.1